MGSQVLNRLIKMSGLLFRFWHWYQTCDDRLLFVSLLFLSLGAALEHTRRTPKTKKSHVCHM